MSQLRSLESLVKNTYIYPPYSILVMQCSKGSLIMILIYNDDGEKVTIHGGDDQELW